MKAIRILTAIIVLSIVVAGGLVAAHRMGNTAQQTDTAIPTVLVTAKRDTSAEAMHTVTIVAKRPSAARKALLALMDARDAAHQWVAEQYANLHAHTQV